MRVGLVATSRSGSTYFRRFLCNVFGLYDPGSWLKKNLYDDIEKENWATQPHILKILPHYIPENQHIGEMISEFPCIWLYRKDVLSQFLSHITRLRTKVNHIHYKTERNTIQQRVPGAMFDEVMYADDTIVVGTDTRKMNQQIAEIEDEGAKYGLKLNKTKCEMCTSFCWWSDGFYLNENQNFTSRNLRNLTGK